MLKTRILKTFIFLSMATVAQANDELGSANMVSEVALSATQVGSRDSKFNECYKKYGKEIAGQDCREVDNPSVQTCTKSKPVQQRTKVKYRYVKRILRHCGAVKGYLPGGNAYNAHENLVKAGFTKSKNLNVRKARNGSVIVYKNICREDRKVGGFMGLGGQIIKHPGSIRIKTSSSSMVSDIEEGIVKDPCYQVTGIYFK